MKKRGINEEFEHTNTTTEKRGQNSTSNNPQKRVKINIGVKQKSDLIHHQDVLRILDGRGTKGSRSARE